MKKKNYKNTNICSTYLNVAPNLAKHSQLLHCTVRFKSQVNVFGGDSQRIGKMVVLSLDDIELFEVVV
jgi:hypothetical protein